MSEWEKMIFGEENVNQREELKKRIAEIENKHKEWFENRPGHNDSQEHDEISNYLMITWDAKNIQMGMSPELPQAIRDDLSAAFKIIFR